jgi:hypothetical protein
MRIDDQGQKQFQDNTLHPGNYQWIMEIAENKRMRFPFLKHLELREENEGRRTSYESQDWGLPDDVKYAFDEAKIELIVNVKVTRVRGDGPGWVRFIPGNPLPPIQSKEWQRGPFGRWKLVKVNATEPV